MNWGTALVLAVLAISAWTLVSAIRDRLSKEPLAARRTKTSSRGTPVAAQSTGAESRGTDS